MFRLSVGSRITVPRLLPCAGPGYLVLWLGSVILKSRYPKKGVGYEPLGRFLSNYWVPNPDPREDLESSSPNLGLGFRVWRIDPLIWGPILLRVLYRNPALRDLLFGSSRGSGYRSL